MLGRLAESNRHLADALRIWQDNGSSYGRQTALNNSGLLAWQTGDFAAARRMYQEAQRLADPNDRRTRGLLKNNIGLIFLSLGDTRQAISNLRESLELIPPRDTTARARSMINIGRAYRLSGDGAASIEWLQRALPLARQAPDPRVLAETLNNLGQSLAATRPADAESNLRQALGIYRTASDQRGISSALHHLGLVRAALNDPRAGLALLDQALRFRLRGGLRDDAADTLAALARVQSSLGNLAEANRDAAQALENIESLRASLPGEQFRIGYFSAKQNFYEFYIELLMRMHRASPEAGLRPASLQHRRTCPGASAARDAARGASGHYGRRGCGAAGAGARDAADLGFLSREMAQLEETRHAPEKEDTLRANLQKAVDAYRNIETEIRDRSPAYASLVWPQPRPLPEIQSKLWPAIPRCWNSAWETNEVIYGWSRRIPSRHTNFPGGRHCGRSAKMFQPWRRIIGDGCERRSFRAGTWNRCVHSAPFCWAL